MIEQLTGQHVPQLTELSEIESSSRLQRRGDTLYLSMPALERTEGAVAHVTPVGFVLSRERLITVRFASLPSFDSFADSCRTRAKPETTSVEYFLGLMEGVVDRIADVLEREGSRWTACPAMCSAPTAGHATSTGACAGRSGTWALRAT